MVLVPLQLRLVLLSSVLLCGCVRACVFGHVACVCVVVWLFGWLVGVGVVVGGVAC